MLGSQDVFSPSYLVTSPVIEYLAGVTPEPNWHKPHVEKPALTEVAFTFIAIIYIYIYF
jgi:hypothetical protein